MNLTSRPPEVFMQLTHDGDVALELEVEGDGLPRMNNQNWVSKGDNSLKIGGVEYIHNGPKKIEEVLPSLRDWESKVTKAQAIVYDSERTGVHVHSNRQKNNLKQIMQSIVAYYMLEPALMKNCGRSRKGNLFCLPMEDGGTVIDLIKKLANGQTTGINWDQYRYASLNIGAIKKFGSLEVRTMRGRYEPEFLNQWATNIHGLFDKAADNFKSPVEVFDYWYGRSPREFLGAFLSSDFVDTLRSYNDWDYKLNRNHLRLADVVYGTDWNRADTTVVRQARRDEEETDPRDVTDTMNRIRAQLGATIPVTPIPTTLNGGAQWARQVIDAQRQATQPRWSEWVTTRNDQQPLEPEELSGMVRQIAEMLRDWNEGYVHTDDRENQIRSYCQTRYLGHRVKRRTRVADNFFQDITEHYDLRWNEWMGASSIVVQTAEYFEIEFDLIPEVLDDQENGDF